MLQAVLFDVDDTLYSTTKFASRARRDALAAMRRHGVRVPLAGLVRELSETIAEFGSNYEHHFEKLWLRLPPSAVRDAHRSLAVAAAVAAYHDAKFSGLRPFPEVPRVLARLARSRLKLGVVTDGLDIKQAEKLVRLGVTRYFPPRSVFISDQIGISKPNPKIYLRACAALRVAPGRAMYVGDHPVKDVDAAKAAGLVTVLVDRGGKHSGVTGRTAPDAVVHDFNDLLQILRRDFRVRLP